jgi:hypothetical protein
MRWRWRCWNRSLATRTAAASCTQPTQRSTGTQRGECSLAHRRLGAHFLRTTASLQRVVLGHGDFLLGIRAVYLPRLARLRRRNTPVKVHTPASRQAHFALLLRGNLPYRSQSLPWREVSAMQRLLTVARVRTR